MPLTEHRVWDRTQRLFHWINFLLVFALAAIGTVILNADQLGIPDDPGMIALKTVHVYVGYLFVLNLLWRCVWGFIGGPYGRWHALLPSGPGFGRQLWEFVRGLAAGRPPFYLGHNPLAKLYLSVLLLMLLTQGLTGLVLAGTDVYKAPLGGVMRQWVAADTHDPALVRPYAPDTVNTEAYARMRSFRAPIVAVHGYGYFILLAMIALHIGAAVVMELKEGGTLISAMFTGRKVHRDVPVDREA